MGDVSSQFHNSFSAGLQDFQDFLFYFQFPDEIQNTQSLREGGGGGRGTLCCESDYVV